MKLIVMGAGYVGMALLKDLQKQSHEIYITTTQEKRVNELKPFGKDVLVIDASQNLEKLIDTCDGMIVLVAPNQSQSYEETYLKTAKRIASALNGRTKPFYLLYTSSTSVCEGIDGEWVTEEMTLNPQSENGKILLATEQCYLNSGVSVCIVRLGGIHGPHRTLLDRAKRFSGKELPGTGEEATNHSHLDDIVAGIQFCLSHSLTGIYHLVSDDHPTRKELYTNLCQQLNLPPPTWNPTLADHRKGGYKVSNRKFKEAVGI
jgi:nucleoside-diphosphate-sugar epimerase